MFSFLANQNIAMESSRNKLSILPQNAKRNKPKKIISKETIQLRQNLKKVKYTKLSNTANSFSSAPSELNRTQDSAVWQKQITIGFSG